MDVHDCILFTCVMDMALFRLKFQITFLIIGTIGATRATGSKTAELQSGTFLDL